MIIVKDTFIGDNPVTRHLEIVDIVLSYCAENLWAADSPQLKNVPRWLKKVKEVLKKQAAGFRLPDSKCKKQGKNGLAAASVDAIVRQDSLENSVGSASFDGQKHSGSVTPVTGPQGNVILVNSDGESFNDDSSTSRSPIEEIPLEVKRLSGGITNQLFRISDRDSPSRAVVVRVFGKETERVISRESELFYQSLFLRTFVSGGNFLVYEFLVGFTALPFEEMPNEMEKIADKMAALQVRATVASKEDVNASGASRFSLEENYTVKSLNDWVNQIASAEIQEKVQDQKRASFIDLGARMQVESEAMRAMIEAHVDQLVEGVCHNDLLCANLMLNEAKKELVIIDFDYTKRNFLLFDIANHFNEYTGLKCDYDTYFPSDSHMRNFITIYREAMRRYILEAHQEQTTLTEVFEGERNFFFTTCEEEEAQVITEWVKLVKWMTLLSNLSWAIWSLFQEAVSDLDVDFLNYAGQRFDRYVLTKQAFLDDIFPNS